ncbi:MAG: Two-component sensor kinase [Candidatus Brocadiaceae bacterium]|nr:Two-component sensor kinase [Candidatus Brocadiaceae bacterium]
MIVILGYNALAIPPAGVFIGYLCEDYPVYSFLVVSSDKVIGTFFKKSLSKDSVVHIAKTAEEALQIFLKIDIDVTFLDVLLNDDGANKLTEELRRTNIEPTIVMIVPESQPMLLEEFRISGEYEYLKKPLRKEAVETVSKRVFEKQELKSELGFIQSHIKNLKPDDTRLSELAFNKQENARVSFLGYKEVFQKFSKVLTRVYDLGKLADLTVEAMAETFGVGRAVFMLLDKNDGLFRPFRCLGLDEITARSICFTTNQGIMPTNKLTVRDAIKIQKEMNLLQAQLCIPIFANGNLSSVIVLGNKITGKAFFDEDIELLSMLAGYIGMAVENAFLYQEANLRRIHNENVLENIPYGIIVINKDCKVNIFNKNAARMLNISSDDVIGKDVKYIGSLFANYLLRTLKDKKTFKRSEVVHPVTRSTYDISTSLLLDNNTELGAIMIFSDLSDVKKMETKIKDLENLVNGYLVNSENTIPPELTQAVTNLSKSWFSDRHRLKMEQNVLK